MKKIFAFFFILGLLHSTYSQVEQDKVLHFLGGNLYGLVGAGVASQISDGDRTWTFYRGYQEVVYSLAWQRKY